MSTKINPKLTQMLERADKDPKTIIIIMIPVFRMLCGNMKDVIEGF